MGKQPTNAKVTRSYAKALPINNGHEKPAGVHQQQSKDLTYPEQRETENTKDSKDCAAFAAGGSSMVDTPRATPRAARQSPLCSGNEEQP